MPAKAPAKVIYTARSQFWFGNLFFKPIDRGGRAIEEGDPMLKSHPAMFEPYAPNVRNYAGREKRT
jgi:hypothetical protein